MNSKQAVIAAAVALALAAPARGQVKYGGYLGLDYINGKAESAYPNGTIENLLAGFLASGQMAQKFSFTVEVRALGVTTFDLNQAWAGFLQSQALTIRAGLYLVPFGSWNTASRPHETLLIRTPLNLECLYPPSWRDLGVLFEGRIGVLSYSGYLGAGLAEGETSPYVQQFRDNNTDWAKGGRLGLIIGQSTRAGFSYYRGRYDDQDTRDLILEGADISWASNQWELHAEWTKALIDNPLPYERGKSEGYAIWGCMAIKGVQPIGSFQTIRFQDPYHGGGIAIDQSRWTAGLRYVLSATFFLKAEYDWNNEKGPELKNDQWQVQMGLSF